VREYLIHRLLLLIPTVLGFTLTVFLMMRFMPGDPVTNMMGEMYSEEDARQLRHELGLDQSLIVQYVKWLFFLLQRDWGRSILTNRPVLTDVIHRLPVSLELLVLSMLTIIPELAKTWEVLEDGRTYVFHLSEMSPKKEICDRTHTRHATQHESAAHVRSHICPPKYCLWMMSPIWNS
jgi:Binding-prot-dependent transport system membrane comp, N-term